MVIIGAALLVAVLAILMMLGVIPMIPIVVGGLFLALSLWIGWPYIDRRGTP